MIQEDKIKEFLGLSEPWSLDSVIDKLAEASDILLHRYNYDGIHWEEISHCVEKSKDYRKRLEKMQILQINNGWTKILSVDDLPDLKDELLIFRNKEGFTTTWQSDDIKSTPNYFLRYSHWRLKDKILEPLF